MRSKIVVSIVAALLCSMLPLYPQDMCVLNVLSWGDCGMIATCNDAYTQNCCGKGMVWADASFDCPVEGWCTCFVESVYNEYNGGCVSAEKYILWYSIRESTDCCLWEGGIGCS